MHCTYGQQQQQFAIGKNNCGKKQWVTLFVLAVIEAIV